MKLNRRSFLGTAGVLGIGAGVSKIYGEGVGLINRGKCELASTDWSVAQERIGLEWTGKFCRGLDFCTELFGEIVLWIF